MRERVLRPGLVVRRTDEFSKPLEGVLDAVLHLELGRAVEVAQHGDCEIPFGHRNGVRDVLEEQHGLGDVHVDLLQFACLVLFLDLFDDPHVLWGDVVEFRFDEVVEVDQRNDVGLVADLYPLLEESVNERQNRPCGSREDRLRRVVCFLPEVREDFEEQRWLIREERIELDEALAVDVVERRVGVLFDARVHK